MQQENEFYENMPLANLPEGKLPEGNKRQGNRKLYIKTYGCQMNFYDSEQMENMMQEQGFSISDNYYDSDLVILNTCHIREKAAEKVYSELGRIRAVKEAKKQQGKQLIIAVAGCVAQAEGQEITRRAPYVDIVVGPQSLQRLPKMVNNAYDIFEKQANIKLPKSAKKLIELDFSAVEKFDYLPNSTYIKTALPSSFLTIQEGCDKFCHFCVVPYTRGAEFSRPVEHILQDARRLSDNGAKEIILLGQNVNAYHGRGSKGNIANLAELIEFIADIPDIERIRYSTSHPKDMDDELIAAHGSVAKLMPQLHLPVQSGSDNILKAMNRKHTRDFYFNIIDKLKKVRSDITFSSDFIVGFPGETDRDFQDTIDLVKRVNYSACYSFKYSPRPGTPASVSNNQIAEAVKQERLAALQDLLNKQQRAYNEKSIGDVTPVLIEKTGKHKGQLTGRTPYMQSVSFACDKSKIGQILNIKIVESTGNSLIGEMI